MVAAGVCDPAVDGLGASDGVAAEARAGLAIVGGASEGAVFGAEQAGADRITASVPHIANRPVETTTLIYN